MIKLCDHLTVEEPTTVNADGQTVVPARLRCGVCRKEFVWNSIDTLYVCVIDPEKDLSQNQVGILFRKEVGNDGKEIKES